MLRGEENFGKLYLVPALKGGSSWMDRILHTLCGESETPNQMWRIVNPFNLISHPARYITHKIHIYLKSYKYRFRDITTAYYCLTKQPIQSLLAEYAPNITNSEPVREILTQLPAFIQNKDGLAVQDIQKTFAQIAYYEDPEDILYALNWLVASLR